MKNLLETLNENTGINNKTSKVITEAKSNTVKADFKKSCALYFIGEEDEADKILGKLLKGLQYVRPAMVKRVYGISNNALAKDYARIIEEIASVLGSITELCRDTDDAEEFADCLNQVTCFCDGSDDARDVLENTLDNLSGELESEDIDIAEEMDNVLNKWDDVCIAVLKKPWE